MPLPASSKRDVTSVATDLTSDIESRAVSKVMRRIMPLLVVLYVANYTNRVNVSFAKLQMNDALGFSDAIYGLGASIFFLGYFVFEVPSNLMLQRVGARLWIARIMISWGAVSTAMLFVKNATGFYLLRFLLGVAEAGFFHGIILYLTYWIPARQRARAGAWFLTSLALAGVVGGPIAGVFLNWHKWGLAGWQWLFLLEGLPTVLLGLVVLMLLPDGPAHVSWLNNEERQALESAIKSEHAAQRPDAHQLRFAVRNPTVWALSILYCVLMFGLYLFGYWTPSILKQVWHGSTYVLGWLSAVPFVAAVAGMLLIGYVADITRWRLGATTWSLLLAAVGMFCCAFCGSIIASLISLSVAAIGVYGSLAPFWAVPPTMLRGSAAAAGIAVINSIGNLGAGLIGPNVVGQLYERDHSYALGLLFTSAVLAAGTVVSAFWSLRQRG